MTANLVHNAFTENLGADFVAISPNGTPVGRASDRASLEQAHAGADVQILDAAELAKLTPTLAEAATAKLDGPFAAVVAQGVGANDDPLAPAPGKILRSGKDDRGLMTMEIVDDPVQPTAENAFAAPGKKTGAEDRPKKDPLDHDADGKKGGNVLNKDKVAADKKTAVHAKK